MKNILLLSFLLAFCTNTSLFFSTIAVLFLQKMPRLGTKYLVPNGGLILSPLLSHNGMEWMFLLFNDFF